MRKIFICDGEHEYSYADLITSVRERSNFSNLLREKNLFDFAVAFISYAANNIDFNIVDSASTDIDIERNYETFGRTWTGKNICAKLILSNEELWRLVGESTSKVGLFTSGTTGRPKRVEHTIKSLSRQVRISGLHTRDIWGFAYDPAHMAGIQVLLQAFFNGSKIVNLFGVTTEEIREKICIDKITHISATPTFYRLLVGKSSAPLPTVIRATIGGERSDSALIEKLEKIFPNARINNVYASTEAGTLFASSGDSFSIPDELAGKIKIENGEILVHKSMLGNSDALKLDDEGFYATGDCAELIGENRFRIIARKNGEINVGGYKVNPEEIEGELRKLDGIDDVVAYGRKSSVTGNILCADIRLLSGANISEPRIREQLSKTLQAYKIPRIINFVKELKLTKTGKAKRS